MNDKAIDTRSVTCALCGEMADERETVSLSPEDYTEFDGYMREDREVYIPDYPNGEAHLSCFRETLDQ